MTNYTQLIEAYEADVEFPQVSGMEHLHMLMRRSEIARGEAHLSGEQRQRLSQADQALLRQARQFYAAIQAVADLGQWRRNQAASPTQWWWYLDIIAQLPLWQPTPTIMLELTSSRQS
jgi:hypothetical protein